MRYFALMALLCGCSASNFNIAPAKVGEHPIFIPGVYACRIGTNKEPKLPPWECREVTFEDLSRVQQ